MVRSRPVNPRASRSALMVASVPEFTRRTISIDGTILRDQLGQFDFALGGRAEAGPDFQHLAQRVDHRLRAVPQQQRSPRAHVIDVGIAVDVEDARAFAALDESRDSADAAKRPHRRIHAAGNHLLRPRKPALRIARISLQ